VHEPAVDVGAHHVDVGAGGHVSGLARADLEPLRSGTAAMSILGMAVFLAITE
jgi:hypothetical protein